MASIHNRERRQKLFPTSQSRRPIKLNSKAQVTLFVILGIVIVASLGAVFMFTRDIEENTPQNLGPKGFIDKCVRDIVDESIDEILASGSVLDPKLSIRYNGTNYTYLCYQSDLYKPCINLYPAMETRLENLIYDQTAQRINDECFAVLREDFENKGYDVTGEGTHYDVDILPGEIRLTLTKPMVISGQGTSQNFENFNTKIISPIQQIIKSTNIILNFESTYCYYDTANHMIVYPDEKVTLVNYDDSKLYKIESRSTGIEFKFAVRGCAYPAGFI